MRFVLCLSLIATAALAWTACGSDSLETSADAGDAFGGITLDIGPDASLTCEAIPEITPGTVCIRQSECGGGLCVANAPGANDGTCHQLCAPDVCDDICPDGTVCVGDIANPATGDVLRFNDGSEAGMCRVSTGSREAYDSCTSMDLCVASSECLPFSEPATERGTCMPRCDSPGGPCDPYLGFETICALELHGDDEEVVGHTCAITCVTAEGEPECPEGLICQAVSGGSICVRPE